MKPGYIISKERTPGENWVKYTFTISGSSGTLKASVIGDYMTHQDLLELEQERKDQLLAVRVAELKIESIKSIESKKDGGKNQSVRGSKNWRLFLVF